MKQVSEAAALAKKAVDAGADGAAAASAQAKESADDAKRLNPLVLTSEGRPSITLSTNATAFEPHPPRWVALSDPNAAPDEVTGVTPANGMNGELLMRIELVQVVHVFVCVCVFHLRFLTLSSFETVSITDMSCLCS